MILLLCLACGGSKARARRVGGRFLARCGGMIRTCRSERGCSDWLRGRATVVVCPHYFVSFDLSSLGSGPI